jgi:hypothetical protein
VLSIRNISKAGITVGDYGRFSALLFGNNIMDDDMWNIYVMDNL